MIGPATYYLIIILGPARYYLIIILGPARYYLIIMLGQPGKIVTEMKAAKLGIWKKIEVFFVKRIKFIFIADLKRKPACATKAK